VAIWAI
jgi:hypothetical protein